MANVISYVSADYERRTFNIGQTHFPEDPVRAMSLVPICPTQESPGETATTPIDAGSKSLEPGSIAGIAVGAFVLLSITAALVWWIQRRRRTERIANEARNQSTHEPAGGGVGGDVTSGYTKHEMDANTAKHELGTNVTEHELDMNAVKYELNAEVVGHELDVNLTGLGLTGQQVGPRELEAESVQNGPGHRQDLASSSSERGVSTVIVGRHVSDPNDNSSSPPSNLCDSPSSQSHAP